MPTTGFEYAYRSEATSCIMPLLPPRWRSFKNHQKPKHHAYVHPVLILMIYNRLMRFGIFLSLVVPDLIGSPRSFSVGSGGTFEDKQRGGPCLLDPACWPQFDLVSYALPRSPTCSTSLFGLDLLLTVLILPRLIRNHGKQHIPCGSFETTRW